MLDTRKSICLRLEHAHAGIKLDRFGTQTLHLALKQVGASQKTSDITVFGIFIDFFNVTELFNRSCSHDGNAVTHNKRFFLVMGDIDKRDTEPLLKLHEFDLQLFTKFKVKS